jgi:hypothetical protein
MPAEVESAPRVVRGLRFAVAHQEVWPVALLLRLRRRSGTHLNYACYASGSEADGAIAYDLHATGCSICVDITRDAMRMLDAGHGLPQIRAEIDRTYAAFGPPNMP